MPLTRRHFELGINVPTEQLMLQVYAFLKADRAQAYSEDELSKQCNVSAADPSLVTRFSRALEVLVEIGALDKALVHDQDYYAFGQEMDTNTWQPKPLRGREPISIPRRS